LLTDLLTPPAPLHKAERYLLPPLTPEEAQDAVERELRTTGTLRLSPALVEAIVKCTGGEPALISLLVGRLRQYPSQPDVDALVAILAELRTTFSNEPVEAREVFEKRLAGRAEEDLAVFTEAIDEIKARPGWLLLVAQLCSGMNPLPAHNQEADAELCLALERENGGYVFANPLSEMILRAYFQPIRVADALVLTDRWADARDYYRQARGVPQGLFASEHYSLSDLIYRATASVSPRQGSQEVARELAEMGRYILGLNDVSVLVGRWQLAQKAWEWQSLMEVEEGAVPQGERRSSTEIARWAEQALRRGPLVVRGGTQLVLAAALDDQGAVALTTSARRRQSIAQQRAARLLFDRLVSLLGEAERLRTTEERISSQVKRLARADWFKEVRSRRNVKQTVQEILKSFEQAGFLDVLVAVVDKPSKKLRGIAASGKMAPLVPWMQVPLEPEGGESNPLLKVIQGGKPLEIYAVGDSRRQTPGNI
jgi:hypothetical protein